MKGHGYARRARWRASVAMAAAMALAWGCAERTAIDPDNPKQVALGRQVYDIHCASCHGANLEGQPDWRQRRSDGKMPAPPHDAGGHTWHHTDEALFNVTREGLAAMAGAGYETDMPAFKDRLSDDQIRAVIAYIKSRWPANIRARQPKASGS